MRQPTPEELSPVRLELERYADMMDEAQALEAAIKHAIYGLKKLCEVPRGQDVVLDPEKGTWVRVGSGQDGKPTMQPLFPPE